MEEKDAERKKKNKRNGENKKGSENIHVEDENTWERFKALCCSCCRKKTDVVAEKEEPTQQPDTETKAANSGGSQGFSVELPAHRTDDAHESEKVPQDTQFSGIKNSLEVAKDREAADKAGKSYNKENSPTKDEEIEDVQDENNKVEDSEKKLESATIQGKTLVKGISDKIATESKDRNERSTQSTEESKSSAQSEDGGKSSTKPEEENKIAPESNEGNKSSTQSNGSEGSKQPEVETESSTKPEEVNKIASESNQGNKSSAVSKEASKSSTEKKPLPTKTSKSWKSMFERKTKKKPEENE